MYPPPALTDYTPPAAAAMTVLGQQGNSIVQAGVHLHDTRGQHNSTWATTTNQKDKMGNTVGPPLFSFREHGFESVKNQKGEFFWRSTRSDFFFLTHAYSLMLLLDKS